MDPKLLRYVATDREIKPGARPFVEKCVLYVIPYAAGLVPWLTHTPLFTNHPPSHLTHRLEYDQALARYPTAAIVLCSWMPMGEDWTARIRAQATVQEYLLIGESGA